MAWLKICTLLAALSLVLAARVSRRIAASLFKPREGERISGAVFSCVTVSEIAPLDSVLKGILRETLGFSRTSLVWIAFACCIRDSEQHD